MSEDLKDATGERGLFYWNRETKMLERKPIQKKQEVNAPYVLRDEILGGIESMVTGRTHYSKSTLRREYKAHGMIEKGNDRAAKPKGMTEEERYKDIREDTEKAYYDLKYDRVPLTEREKHQCEMENRELQRMRRR
jgi:hypothetical protein